MAGVNAHCCDSTQANTYIEPLQWHGAISLVLSSLSIQIRHMRGLLGVETSIETVMESRFRNTYTQVETDMHVNHAR